MHRKTTGILVSIYYFKGASKPNGINKLDTQRKQEVSVIKILSWNYPKRKQPCDSLKNYPKEEKITCVETRNQSKIARIITKAKFCQEYCREAFRLSKQGNQDVPSLMKGKIPATKANDCPAHQIL